MSRIISPENLYSKIFEFLFLFNHMHEFLHFYLFIIFLGVYRVRLVKPSNSRLIVYLEVVDMPN